MAKRHVLLFEKIQGDNAILHPETLQTVGLPSKGGKILVTSSATYFVLAAVGNKTVPEHNIKLPRKLSLVLKEGERLTIQPAPGVKPGASPPKGTKPSASSAASVSEQRRQTDQEPGSNGPTRPQAKTGSVEAGNLKWDSIAPSDLEDIAGLGPVKDRIEQAIFHLTHPEWFLVRRSLPPRVFLFFGPYGCGKTMLAKAMASRLAFAQTDGKNLPVKFKAIRPTDIKDPYLGMSARKAQQFLDEAREECNRGSTVMLLLDEIDSVISNRSDGNTHEEYRDVVNSLIQDIQGVQDLETESRIRSLWGDPEVEEVRHQLAALVRKEGRKNRGGDISLPEKSWTPEVRSKMLHLRERVVAAGGVSTVIVVGTTNDPLRIDEAFLSRAGDNIFFVPRPSGQAIDKMLADELDSAFVELTESERRDLAHEAYREGLTGRDIVLSWLQPLRSVAPGSLQIMGRQTVAGLRPAPVVGIEWEMDLLDRLAKRSQASLATQVQEYLDSVLTARKDHEGGSGRSGDKGRKEPVIS